MSLPYGVNGVSVQVAVVGCGYWGKNLVRVFHSLGALRSVCDSTPEGLATSRKIAPDVPAASDFESLLSDQLLDGIVIATPAESHHRLAHAAMEAGKHVFVEKPLALHYREGLQLARLARARRRILMVGHILEYHPAVTELQRRIAAGELGAIQYVYSNRLNLGKIRREENILWSFAPHDIAVMLRLVGQRPFEVSATGGSYLQPNIADVTVTNLLFDRGVRGHVFVSWLHPYKEQRLVVIGSSRMAVFDDVSKDSKLTIYDQGIDWIDGQPVPRKKEGEVIALPDAEPLRLEAEHFLDCIRDGRAPLTDGRSALQVLEVLEAAQRSLTTNGQLVPLMSQPIDWESL